MAAPGWGSAVRRITGSPFVGTGIQQNFKNRTAPAVVKPIVPQPQQPPPKQVPPPEQAPPEWFTQDLPPPGYVSGTLNPGYVGGPSSPGYMGDPSSTGGPVSGGIGFPGHAGPASPSPGLSPLDMFRDPSKYGWQNPGGTGIGMPRAGPGLSPPGGGGVLAW